LAVLLEEESFTNLIKNAEKNNDFIKDLLEFLKLFGS